MPENEYCLDNFFYKMTDLESPKKNNDCYFYYYSTCTKGDRCMFRHEPSALGCETMCSFWKEGKCINIHCNFRHMELRKNRKSIPCYWESQPGGCKKPHCPFLHLSPKSDSDIGETSNHKSNSDLKEADLRGGLKQSRNDDFGPAVDPLVVNFEEESDNESAPSQSPIKTQQHPSQQHQHRDVKVKTLEEIKLERIQAESAAYYSYEAEEIEDNELMPSAFEDADFLRNRIISRLNTKQEKPKRDAKEIEILSLEEIRKRKHTQDSEQPVPKKPKTHLPVRKVAASNLSKIRVKTLAELKAERTQRFGLDIKRKNEDKEVENSRVSNAKKGRFLEESDSEVSSTSGDTNKVDALEEEERQRKTVIKLRRVKSPIVFDNVEKSPKRRIIRLRKNDDCGKIESSDQRSDSSLERINQDSELQLNKEDIKVSTNKEGCTHLQDEKSGGNVMQQEGGLFKIDSMFDTDEHLLKINQNKSKSFTSNQNTEESKPFKSNQNKSEENELKMQRINIQGMESFSSSNVNTNTKDNISLNIPNEVSAGNSETKQISGLKETSINTTTSEQTQSDSPNIKEPAVSVNKPAVEKSASDETDSNSSDKLELDSSKYEQLLLEDDDEDASMTLQTDDDILKDIDSLLDD